METKQRKHEKSDKEGKTTMACECLSCADGGSWQYTICYVLPTNLFNEWGLIWHFSLLKWWYRENKYLVLDSLIKAKVDGIYVYHWKWIYTLLLPGVWGGRTSARSALRWPAYFFLTNAGNGCAIKQTWSQQHLHSFYCFIKAIHLTFSLKEVLTLYGWGEGGRFRDGKEEGTVGQSVG